MPQRVVWSCFKADKKTRDENEAFTEKIQESCQQADVPFDWDIELDKWTEIVEVPRCR